jgi:hypothetical protein
MRQTPALFAVLVAVAVPAQAFNEASAQARIGSLFAGAGQYLGAWQAPAPAPIPVVQGKAVGKKSTPLIPKSYWDNSAAPHASHAAWLQKRIPDINIGMVREISYADVSQVIDNAAARGWSTLDIFTDEGLRGQEMYYLQASTLKSLFANFDLATALVQSGKDVDGSAFSMDGLVMGGGKLYVLFNRGPFKFDHPSDDRRYEVQARITQTIEGPGKLAVSGMAVKHWPVWPTIQRLIKLPGGKMRVETNYGSQDQNDRAVRRR